MCIYSENNIKPYITYFRFKNATEIKQRLATYGITPALIDRNTSIEGTITSDY